MRNKLFGMVVGTYEFNERGKYRSRFNKNNTIF